MDVIADWASGAGAGSWSKRVMLTPALLILMYHRVLPRPDPMRPGEIDACTFDRHVSVLARYYHVLTLAEAARQLRTRSLRRRAVCITFDDGYADNAELALPILRRWRVPATFFVATGFLDGGRMWNDTVIELVRAAPGNWFDVRSLQLGEYSLATPPQRCEAAYALLAKLKYIPPGEREDRVQALAERVGAELPTDLMMTRPQVRALAEQGMEIGAHSISHPILARLDDAAAGREIIEGKQQLEAIVGRPVEVFAYPNGKPREDYEWRHVRMAQKAGFACAVTTVRGVANANSDLYQLPRFSVWDTRRARFLLRLLQYRWQPNYRYSRNYPPVEREL
jgi:peptidoglycan/xylan/chitin deacetylase (PgdA/CDA1 family)